MSAPVRGVWTIHIRARRWRRVPFIMRDESFVTNGERSWDEVEWAAQKLRRMGAHVLIHPGSCDDWWKEVNDARDDEERLRVLERAVHLPALRGGHEHE